MTRPRRTVTRPVRHGSQAFVLIVACSAPLENAYNHKWASGGGSKSVASKRASKAKEIYLR